MNVILIDFVKAARIFCRIAGNLFVWLINLDYCWNSRSILFTQISVPQTRHWGGSIVYGTNENW